MPICLLISNVQELGHPTYWAEKQWTESWLDRKLFDRAINRTIDQTNFGRNGYIYSVHHIGGHTSQSLVITLDSISTLLFSVQTRNSTYYPPSSLWSRLP